MNIFSRTEVTRMRKKLNWDMEKEVSLECSGGKLWNRSCEIVIRQIPENDPNKQWKNRERENQLSIFEESCRYLEF